MKIAPTLRKAHPRPLTARDAMQGRYQAIISYHAESAYRELQALLAVARAAHRWRCSHPGGLTVDEERIVSALARLEKVPRRKP